MRYYRMVIQNPKTGEVVAPPGFSAALLGGATYTSFVNGKTLPAAWDVEVDIPVIDAATSQGFAIAKVWGVGRDEISQARDLNGFNVSIEGGMQKGLPLANPNQAGLLTRGTIFQAFGNWIGTDQRLDMVIMPGPPATASSPGGVGTLAAPKNLTWRWPAGTQMAVAIQNCLATAFPGATINVSISQDLVRGQDDNGPFPTLEVFSQYVKLTSRSIVRTAGYQGVSIGVVGNTFTVTDGTVAGSSPGKKVTEIAFQDLIGQPTWIQAPLIQLKTVMRADLALFGQIKLPKTVVTNTQQAASSLVNQQASFQGTFDVVNLRHVGRYRNPGGDAWVTVIEAVPTPSAAPANFNPNVLSNLQ